MHSNKVELDKARQLCIQAEQLACEEAALHNINVITLSREDTDKLVHELQVHQIELQLQNEQLRSTQSELETSKNKYFELYDLAPVSYITLDRNGLIKEANLTFGKLVGCQRKYLIGKLLSQFIKADDQDIYYLFKKQLHNSGILCVCELRMVTLVGKEFSARIEANSIHDSDSSDVTYRLTISDVSAQKLAEQIILNNNVYLEQKVKERTIALELSNDELEAFSASVAHDLSSPLRTIDGYSQILLDDYEASLDSEAKRILCVIKQSAARMHEIITSLLDLARISRYELKLARVNVKNIVLEVWNEIEAETKGTVAINISDLPEALGDKRLTKNIFENLLSNAIKFTRNNPIREITVTGTRKDRFVEYCVTDTGAGFDMAYYNKLFKAFHRLHGEKEFEGTGIGLSIVLRIVKKHGGDIWATSEVSKGASFYFTLPAVE